MSSIENTIKTLDERESVTTISANARIDYILKFSKHAVLVLDDDPEIYSSVGNEFLASLSQEHNAAFVPISSKLNDIQVRCRIIEQLFGNSLFDPEQALSVNVIKLSETKNVAITIVIGNAELLSTQVTHELCQLAEVAKKLNKTINVLLLGKTQAAINLSANKYLFANKISILLAESGQVVDFNSELLNKKAPFQLNKASLIISILIFSLVSVIYLFTRHLFLDEPSDKPINTTPENNIVANEYQKGFVKVNTTKVNNSHTSKDLIATPLEVFQSLTTQLEPAIKKEDEISIESKITTNTHAKNLAVDTSNDIKLDNELGDVKNNKLASKKLDVIAPESSNNEVADKPQNYGNEAYYKSVAQGYVIQLASFEKLTGYKSFLNTYQAHSLYGYTRSLNGIRSHIVTSHVFNTNVQAKTAINALPQELRQRGPWIKSLQAVNNEINLYQQSR